MTPVECRKYAKDFLKKGLTGHQWAAIAFIVGEEYPVGDGDKYSMISRLKVRKKKRPKTKEEVLEQ